MFYNMPWIFQLLLLVLLQLLLMQILSLNFRTSHPFARLGLIMAFYVPDVLEHAMDFPAAAAAAFATIVTAAAAAAACALPAVAAATASASTAVLLDIRGKVANNAVVAEYSRLIREHECRRNFGSA